MCFSLERTGDVSEGEQGDVDAMGCIHAMQSAISDEWSNNDDDQRSHQVVQALKSGH